MEVALHRLAALDGDLPPHQVTHPFDNRALALIDGAARVDDLAPDIADDPGLVHLDAVLCVDRDFGHVGEVAAMAVLESHAHRGAFRQLPLAPPGPIAHRLEHAAHAGSVESVAPLLRLRHRRSVEDLEAERD